MRNTKNRSVEPNVANLVNGWLKSYGLDYKLEQDSLNPQIDKALEEYYSKNGGNGGNRPDAKLIIRDSNLHDWPILIEYKGYKDRLVKFGPDGQIANRTAKNDPDFKNINSYAVNGAVHYANALLHYTDYSDIIAIGVTGWRNDFGDIDHEIGVYYVSKSNFGSGQKVDDYTDLSFLRKRNFNAFVQKVKTLALSPEEIEHLKEQREREIGASLIKLNNDIYQNEKGLSENDRVYLVAASIIATIGIPGKVATLEKSELKSSIEDGNRDGDIIVRKINAFLSEKKLPKDKRTLIVRTLQNTLTTDNINKPVKGESQLKRIFTKIVDDLGIYYKSGLTTDFTGKLFNEMYGWLGFSQDKLNDVVLTPFYVATLLVRLARVNKDSFVWDFAAGSAGLLVAAMNEMLVDAKAKIKSQDVFQRKAAEIKARQLLGIEVLSNIYMLAVLNMILMGDGSSNILNCDSLKDFVGNYGFGVKKFPADAFVLNPPYSAPGNGMVFVERALSMMSKGYAAIIIQNSAGNGKAVEYNKKILKHSTLLASIKMPPDLFVGKSNVQTQIYVFRVGEAHHRDDVVKFIDFSNDGYIRTNRKKSTSNLRDADRAKERYDELVDLVRYGKSKLSIYTKEEYYEGSIDPNNGMDWNQIAPVNTKPILGNYIQTVSDYLSWEMSNCINQPMAQSTQTTLNGLIKSVKWRKIKLGSLFHIENTMSFNKNKLVNGGDYDYVTRTSENQGILRTTGFINQDNLNHAGTWSLGLLQMDFFYRKRPWYAGQFVRKIIPKINIPTKAIPFFTTILNRQKKVLRSVLIRKVDETFRNILVDIPVSTKNNTNLLGEIDYGFMEAFIRKIEDERMRSLIAYLKTSNLDNSPLPDFDSSAYNPDVFRPFQTHHQNGHRTRRKQSDFNNPIRETGGTICETKRRVDCL